MLKLVNFLFWLALLLCSFVIVLVIVTASFPFRLLFFAVHRQLTHLQTILTQCFDSWRVCSSFSPSSPFSLFFHVVCGTGVPPRCPAAPTKETGAGEEQRLQLAVQPQRVALPAGAGQRAAPAADVLPDRWGSGARQRTHAQTFAHTLSAKTEDNGLMLCCKVQKCWWGHSRKKKQGSVSGDKVKTTTNIVAGSHDKDFCL